MEEFFAYEHIKELVVHGAFGWMLGMMVFSYGYLIYTGVRWIVKTVRKLLNKKNVKEDADNVCD